MGSLEIVVKSFGDVDQSLEAKPNGSRLVVLPFLFLDERTGNIQMCPGRTFGHEFLQEESCSECTGDWSPDVIQIGARDFEEFFVLLGERKFPIGLSVVFSGLDDGAN